MGFTPLERRPGMPERSRPIRADGNLTSPSAKREAPVLTGFTAAKEAFLDILFPKFCVGCGDEGQFLCGACKAGLIFSAPSCPLCQLRNFDGVLCSSCQEKSGLRRFLAPFSYRRELARDLIHAYKYEGVRELADYFSQTIAEFLNFYRVRLDGRFILVPIPLHRRREAERGFNQARLLAEKLGGRFGCEVVDALKRRRRTEQQIEMESYDKRRENVAGAFEVINGELVKNHAVILIDDVSTSGATIFEAARLLRQSGANTVWAIVIAKG